MDLYNIVWSCLINLLIFLLIEGIIYFAFLTSIFDNIIQNVINDLSLKIKNKINYFLFDPSINKTIGFNLTPLAGSHPFHIRLGDNSADFSNGLVHISSTGTLSYGSAAQGQTSGTLLWRIPHTAVGNYKYRCSAHPGAMIGDINVANTANIYFAYSS